MSCVGRFVNVNDPGRIPFQSAAFTTQVAGLCTLPLFNSVPTNHRLVVEHISGVLTFANATPEAFVYAQIGNSPGALSQFFVPLFILLLF
jgi:hypothetical protein